MLLDVLRFAFAPAIVIIVTWTQRRFGHVVGGLLVGLPVTTIPLLWLVAASHGAAFAGSMAATTFRVTAVQIVALYLYAVLSQWWSPLPTLAVTLGAFAVVVVAVALAHLSLVAAGALTLATLALALRHWPTGASLDAGSGRYRLGLRVALVAVFTTVLSLLSGVLGTTLAGMLGAIPVMSLTVVVLTHRELGADAASGLLRGVIKGSYSYAVALLVLAELLSRGEVLEAFLVATLAAAATQLVVLGVDVFPRRARPLEALDGTYRAIPGSWAPRFVVESAESGYREFADETFSHSLH